MQLYPFMGAVLVSSALVLTGCGSGGDSGDSGGSTGGGDGSGNSAPSISGSPAMAKEGERFTFTPEASDPEGGELRFELINAPDWMSIDPETGEVSGMPGAGDLGMRRDIVIRVSDGKKASDLKFNLEIAFNPVEQAIRMGNALLVDDSYDLVQAGLETIADIRNHYRQARIDIFNLDSDGTAKDGGDSLTSITWDPTHDAAQLEASFGNNEVILVSNASKNGGEAAERGLAVVGETVETNAGGDKTRYLVMGSNPMRNMERSAEINEQMHQFMLNSIGWLVRRSNFDEQPLQLVIAQMDDGYWFPDATATRNWMDDRFTDNVNYNAKGECDGTNLAECLSADPDLLIISQKSDAADAEEIAETVAEAMAEGVPVLYMHLDGNLTALGAELFDLFNVAYQEDNYWKKLYLSGYDSLEHMGEIPASVARVQIMLDHFRLGDYAFNWSACDEDDCSGVSGLQSEFYDGAEEVRDLMKGLDESKVDVFAGPGNRYTKLLALIGDHFRSTVSYPMDKVTTDDTAFLKSLYADHAVYNYRSLNPAQPDMGNFSRSNFDHITPVSKTIDMESKRYFRAAGVYALPGQTVTVSRLDDAEVTTAVFVNTQRPGATHLYQDNGYNRPKFLQTPKFSVAPGETISFTSTYGGPIQIQFGENGQNVSLRFSNVGEHPFWNGDEDHDSFERALAEGDYDWAELVTPGFEVHSKLDKMRESMQDDNWKTGAALAAGTMRYVHNFPHVLAGFEGPGIEVVSEIHDFAESRDLDIAHIDLVKHMNADQATCGYGCSGNPYDAYWSFSPIGHGDIHELGHGLERSRFRFVGWEGHASTNPYAYYSKSQYHLDTGNNPQCQSLPFESMFNVLRESVGKTDPEAYVREQNLNGWSNGVGIMIQIMMSAQGEGTLNDGWNLLPRMHILERNFNAALSSEADWLAARGNLGLSTYSYNEAKNIEHNDWLVMAISYASGLDFRDYLTMWALPFTDKASAQIAAYGYSAAPREYYVSEGDGYCYGLNKSSLAVDGVQTWP
ncbi:ImpA family metalloprotease [Hahella ganghwensis]|uniref:ImpA family metalloprotease n=1 Tax=Hahella ganghwensis TaxID=286420 RepID=UPI00037C5FB2|nr:ImpA family metalloprotease [Hahella ganghwensis]